MPRILVSILTDDRIFGEGLRRILATDNSLTFVAFHEQPPEHFALSPAQSDILLVDARIEGATAVCERAKQAGGPATILVAVRDDEASAVRALAAGARGVLQKSAHSEDVPKAIHVVASGQVWAPRHVIVAAWLNATKHSKQPPAIDSVLDPHLTAREMEVLHHAAAGRGNKEVAGALAISEATVKVHLTRIFQKLGLHGRAQLAAVYHGIVAPVQVSIPRQPVRRRA